MNSSAAAVPTNPRQDHHPSGQPGALTEEQRESAPAERRRDDREHHGQAGHEPSPRSRARMTAEVRSVTSSLAKIAVRLLLTVLGDRWSVRAMSAVR